MSKLGAVLAGASPDSIAFSTAPPADIAIAIKEAVGFEVAVWRKDSTRGQSELHIEIDGGQTFTYAHLRKLAGVLGTTNITIQGVPCGVFYGGQTANLGLTALEDNDVMKTLEIAATHKGKCTWETANDEDGPTMCLQLTVDRGNRLLCQKHIDALQVALANAGF